MQIEYTFKTNTQRYSQNLPDTSKHHSIDFLSPRTSSNISSIDESTSLVSFYRQNLIKYTTAVCRAAPMRNSFDGKMGFKIYYKLNSQLQQESQSYHFQSLIEKIDSLGIEEEIVKEILMGISDLGPICLIDQILGLFVFIINRLKSDFTISNEICLDYLKQSKFRYINFNNKIMNIFQAKTPAIQAQFQKSISTLLTQLLQTTISLLESIILGQKLQISRKELTEDEQDCEIVKKIKKN